jgi:hypothetical protein
VFNNLALRLSAVLAEFGLAYLHRIRCRRVACAKVLDCEEAPKWDPGYLRPIC